jgi:hypothetical protein
MARARVERSGPKPDLEALFTRFVREQLSGVVLDDQADQLSADGKFPDFACLRDLVLLEMKHLQESQHDKVQQTFKQTAKPEEVPLFFGQMTSDRVLPHLSNADQVTRAISNKVSRTIENLIRTANRQFRNWEANHSRSHRVRICMILNSDILEFSPSLVGWAISRALSLKSDRQQPYRFPYVDGVIYISEKHFTPLPDGRIAHAIGVFVLDTAQASDWKQATMTYITDRWSRWRTGTDPIAAPLGTEFDVVEDIPPRMKRYQAWELHYRRRPYLRHLPEEQLRALFYRLVLNLPSALAKGDPIKPSKEAMENIERFSHVMEEVRHRGIDLRTWPLTDTERAAYQQAMGPFSI